MPLVSLILQEYSSEVFQPITSSPEPKIQFIQPSLDTSYSPFVSSSLLTLDLLLPHSITPMNITVLDYLSSSIPFIYQSTSTSPIVDQFPTDNRLNIYFIYIDNEGPTLTATAVQILRDRQNSLDPRMLRLSSHYDILQLSPPLNNTPPYFIKVITHWILPSIIMKSSPLPPPLSNLQILGRPSKDPTGSTR